MNPKIDVGCIVEVEENKETITEFYLTKIITITDDGTELTIPTQKIHQELSKIYPKNKKT